MNVVIVDDTPTNVTLMQALVGKIEGCQPVTFTDSENGLRWCLDNDPDLIIVDYMMPAPDGLEFIQRMRRVRERGETPMLMVTADHERQVRYAALDLGASDFLTKPIDRIEFQSRVRNMLALRQSHLYTRNRAAELAAAVDEATAAIYAREHETIMRLSRAAEFRDADTGVHILRMAHYSELIAANLELPREFRNMLLHVAPMHDVGKLGTPDRILLKPGRLEHDELAIMRRHARDGYDILKDSASPALQMAARIALHHHERYDGTGYPSGMAGEAIPIEGRIVAVADVYDALTSPRPYKLAWDPARAADYLRENRGRHFDPSCVDAFLRGWEQAQAIRRRFADSDG